jgi:hypothetical protein
MNSWGRLLILSALVTSLLVSGCTGVKIASHPPGARIYFNGEDTGCVTPTTFKIRDMPKGHYMVSLAKDGYVMAGPPQRMKIWTDPGKVFCTILFFPIAFPVELGTTMWKRSSPRHLTNFVLHPVGPQPAAYPPAGAYPPGPYAPPPAAPPPPGPKESGPASIEQRLKHLNELYDKSLITREEYETRRAEILKGI